MSAAGDTAAPDARSGLDTAGEWREAFEGQRPPAGEGNTLALRHGAYAAVRLSEKASETADALLPLLPVYSPSDEPLLQAFAFTLEQLKAASTALEDPSQRKDRLRLSQDARGWALACLRYAEHFGLTPRSRVALGLDLVRGEAAKLTVTRLAALAEREGEAA